MVEQVRKNNMTEEQMLQLKEPGVGETRIFSNYDKVFSIRHILLSPEPRITLQWTWTTKIDPRTKERVTDTRIHTFYRIEVLGDVNIEDADLTKDDIVLLGFGLDNRLMHLPIDKYNEVFEQIEGFNKIKESLNEEV